VKSFFHDTHIELRNYIDALVNFYNLDDFPEERDRTIYCLYFWMS
jgi:hypothetical protein